MLAYNVPDLKLHLLFLVVPTIARQLGSTIPAAQFRLALQLQVLVNGIECMGSINVKISIWNARLFVLIFVFKKNVAAGYFQIQFLSQINFPTQCTDCSGSLQCSILLNFVPYALRCIDRECVGLCL